MCGLAEVQRSGVLRARIRVVSQSLRSVHLDFVLNLQPDKQQVEIFMINFKGNHYPKDVILYAVFFYVRYAVSYRDLEEIMAERGVEVDHATLNRWVVKFSPLIACEALVCPKLIGPSYS